MIYKATGKIHTMDVEEMDGSHTNGGSWNDFLVSLKSVSDFLSVTAMLDVECVAGSLRVDFSFSKVKLLVVADGLTASGSLVCSLSATMGFTWTSTMIEKKIFYKAPQFIHIKASLETESQEHCFALVVKVALGSKDFARTRSNLEEAGAIFSYEVKTLLLIKKKNRETKL